MFNWSTFPEAYISDLGDMLECSSDQSSSGSGVTGQVNTQMEPPHGWPESWLLCICDI